MCSSRVHRIKNVTQRRHSGSVVCATGNGDKIQVFLLAAAPSGDSPVRQQMKAPQSQAPRRLSLALYGAEQLQSLAA